MGELANESQDCPNRTPWRELLGWRSISQLILFSKHVEKPTAIVLYIFHDMDTLLHQQEPSLTRRYPTLSSSTPPSHSSSMHPLFDQHIVPGLIWVKFILRVNFIVQNNMIIKY